MFIASFPLKTHVQKLLFTLQDYLDFPRLHPARELKKLALRESVRYARKHMRDSVGVESAREVLSMALEQVVAGHHMEFGVYKGGTIRFIARRVRPSQIVHGFDSFQGLDQAWSGDPSRFDAHGKLPRVPSNVVLHKGYFADTLPVWIEDHPGPVGFLHIDCDLYLSTKTIFEHLADRIVPGTVIVFDQYFNYPNWQEHEFRAFQELVERFQVRYQYLGYARFQVAIKINEIRNQASLENLSSHVSVAHTGKPDFERQEV